MTESLVRAFPARLAPVVTDVVKRLPESRFPPYRSVTESYARSWPGLVVAGEPVVIPARIYNPSPRFWRPLGHLEKLVVAGIYSRHDDGFVRQRWLGMLLDADEPWVAPFIIQLLGEYVIEICRDIERFAQLDLPARSALRQHLSAFLHDNPCFAELTRQRAVSYWHCYYRAQYPSQDTYPALGGAVGTQRRQHDLTSPRTAPTLRRWTRDLWPCHARWGQCGAGQAGLLVTALS